MFCDLSIAEMSRKYGMSGEGISLNISNSLRKLGLNPSIRRIKSTLSNYQKHRNKILLEQRERREKKRRENGK